MTFAPSNVSSPISISLAAQIDPSGDTDPIPNFDSCTCRKRSKYNRDDSLQESVAKVFEISLTFFPRLIVLQE